MGVIEYYHMTSKCWYLPRTNPANSSQEPTKENTTEFVANCQCRRDHWFLERLKYRESLSTEINTAGLGVRTVDLWHENPERYPW